MRIKLSANFEGMGIKPRVGKVVAFNLISEMPELGYINNKEASSLVGVAPFNRESGSYKGKGMIHGNDVRDSM